jgi:hypothetical protein
LHAPAGQRAVDCVHWLVLVSGPLHVLVCMTKPPLVEQPLGAHVAALVGVGVQTTLQFRSAGEPGKGQPVC